MQDTSGSSPFTNLDKTNLKTITLTELDAAVIAVALAFTGAILAGAIPEAVAIEAVAGPVWEQQTDESTERLTEQLNSVTDLLATARG